MFPHRCPRSPAIVANCGRSCIASRGASSVGVARVWGITDIAFRCQSGLALLLRWSSVNIFSTRLRPWIL